MVDPFEETRISELRASDRQSDFAHKDGSMDFESRQSINKSAD